MKRINDISLLLMIIFFVALCVSETTIFGIIFAILWTFSAIVHTATGILQANKQ